MSQALVTEIQTVLSADQLQELSGLPKEIFSELQEIGAFEDFADNGSYNYQSVIVVSKANRLRRTFDLDASALALLIHFINQTEVLKNQLHKLQVRNINPYL